MKDTNLIDIILHPKNIEKMDIPMNKTGARMIKIAAKRGYFPNETVLANIYNISGFFSSESDEEKFFKQMLRKKNAEYCAQFFKGDSIEIWRMIVEKNIFWDMKYDGENVELWKKLVQDPSSDLTGYSGTNDEIWRLIFSDDRGIAVMNNYKGDNNEIWEYIAGKKPDALLNYRGDNVKIWKCIAGKCPNFLRNYHGDDIEVWKAVPDEKSEYLDNYKGKNNEIWKYIAGKYPDALKNYDGDDIEVWKAVPDKESKALGNYKGKNNEIWEYIASKNPEALWNYRGDNVKIWKCIAGKCPNFLKNYHGDDIEVWKAVPDKESKALRNYKGNNVKVWVYIVDKWPYALENYDGDDIEVWKAVSAEKSGILCYYKGKNNEIWKYIAGKNPDALKNYDGDDIEVWKAVPDKESEALCNYKGDNYEIWMYIVGKFPSALKNYDGNNNAIWDMIADDVSIDIALLNYRGDNVKIWKYIAGKYPDALENYDGDDIEVWKAVPTENKAVLNYYQGNNLEIWKYIYGIFPDALCNYKGDNYEIWMYIVGKFPSALKNYNGENIEIWEFIANNTEPGTVTYFGENVDVIKKLFQLKYIDSLSIVNIYNRRVLAPEELFSLIVKRFDSSASSDEVNMIFAANNLSPENKAEFLMNYEKIMDFIEKSGVSKSDFIRYSLNTSRFDYLKNIIEIINGNKIEQFLACKNYFDRENFNIDSLNPVRKVESFNLLMVAYNKYMDLFNNISKLNRSLTEEEKKCIEILMNNVVIDYNSDEFPKEVSEITGIYGIMKKSLNEHIDLARNTNDKEMIKNCICEVLFNQSLENVKRSLKKFGNVEELKYLKFINKDKLQLCDGIEEVIILTSIIEKIVYEEDIEYLKGFLENMTNNIEATNKLSIIFNRYEEMIRNLYEMEIQENFTNISIQEIDAKKSNANGTECVDLRGKKYVLCAHIRSVREDPDKLAKGEAGEGQNFISLFAISNRKQHYYADGTKKDIIFGYDSLPKGSFVCSSTTNMSSNSWLTANSSDVSIPNIKQRGILEESVVADNNNNSEILCYRDGLKPSCIIIPDGYSPNDEEIELARQYGLKIVYTQKIDEYIVAPKETITEKKVESFDRKGSIDELKALRDELLTVGNSVNFKKRIAIFTDAHALYEPTLAILEDARRKGISEIYSLGDNVGTGPNPREVMDLLNEYGVVSLEGNHEMYANGEIDRLRAHLEKTGAVDEAERMGKWTGEKLTQAQKDQLGRLPMQQEIEIGGEKILLCHYTRDYNNGNLVIDRKERYHRIFQGHVHFKNDLSDGNVMTLRGAGIGEKGGNNDKAYYIVLTEKEGGGYDIEEVCIPTRNDFTWHSINESDLAEADKSKISGWTR